MSAIPSIAPAAPASTAHTLTRERRFDPRDGLYAILLALHESRATGRLCIDMSQGSVGGVSFEERQKLASVKD
jgi:hypothetical protein